MTVTKWRLWYDDGYSVEGSTYEEWCAAPSDAVVFGMWFFSDGTAAIVAGLDLYWAQDFGKGLVFAHDSDRDGILRRLPWVKFGRWTTMEQHAELQSEALKLAERWNEEIGGAPPEKCAGCK